MTVNNIIDMTPTMIYIHIHIYIYICDRLRENRPRKHLEKIDRFLKNVLFQADERIGLL